MKYQGVNIRYVAYSIICLTYDIGYSMYRLKYFYNKVSSRLLHTYFIGLTIVPSWGELLFLVPCTKFEDRRASHVAAGYERRASVEAAAFPSRGRSFQAKEQ